MVVALRGVPRMGTLTRALCTILMLAAMAAPAVAAPAPGTNPQADLAADLSIASAAFQGPCAGHLTVVWDETSEPPWITPEQSSTIQAWASGIHINDDGSWTLVGCDMTIRPSVWLRLSPIERCSLVVHEAGHLAMRRHTATGVMAPNGGPFEPCRIHYVPLYDRIGDDIDAMVPIGWDVICGDQHRHVVRCQAVHGRRVRRYVVRVHPHGDFTITRVRKTHA